MKNGIFIFSKGAEFASAANANEGHQHIFSCETRVRFQLPLVFTPFWYKNERHDNKSTASFCPAFLSAKAESRTSADDIHHWRLSWGVHYSFSSRVKAICLRLILRSSGAALFTLPVSKQRNRRFSAKPRCHAS